MTFLKEALNQFPEVTYDPRSDGREVTGRELKANWTGRFGFIYLGEEEGLSVFALGREGKNGIYQGRPETGRPEGRFKVELGSLLESVSKWSENGHPLKIGEVPGGTLYANANDLWMSCQGGQVSASIGEVPKLGELLLNLPLEDGKSWNERHEYTKLPLPQFEVPRSFERHFPRVSDL